MEKFISEETVKNRVESAEVVLDRCFSMLLDIKHANESLGNAITEFQPTLADCLFNLMEFYHELNAEKRTLISEKTTYLPDDFALRMQTNAKYMKVIRECI